MNVRKVFDLIMNTFSLRAEIFPSEKCKRVIKFILSRNIQCENTLTCMNEFDFPLLISEWQLNNDLSIIRKDIKFES